MKEKKYRLDGFLITEYDASLYCWETHVALAERRSGNCRVTGNILVIERWTLQEPGYLILEFHEALEKLPSWDKTKYYCFDSNLKDVRSRQDVFIDKNHLLRFENDSEPENDIIYSDFGEFRLGKYRVITKKCDQITWELFAEDNRIDHGDCVIESGILFLKSKKEDRHTNQDRKEWIHKTDLLPIWRGTKTWGHWSVIKICEEKKDSIKGRAEKPEKKEIKDQKQTQIEQPEIPLNLENERRRVSKRLSESSILGWFKVKKNNRKTVQTEHQSIIGYPISKSVLVSNVIPFIIWFSLLIAAVMSADYFLHKFQIIWIGRYLGIPGISLLILSFVYSIKKHLMAQSGSTKALLSYHISLTWIGALLITVHAGIHFNAILPWSAYISMVVVVLSGLVGEVLLKDARKTLRFKYTNLINQGYSKEEVERKVFLDALSVKMMTRWRSIHKPITWVFSILAIIHVITILMFWSWLK